MHDLIEKIAGATEGTHLVPVLLVIEDGAISIEPIENLNKRLSSVTTNPKAVATPKPEPFDLPIEGMKKALTSPKVVVKRSHPGNSHFSMAFKQFCYDLMRDGLSPEVLHAKLVQGEDGFGEDIPRVPCLSTLVRWDEAGVVRKKKGKGKRKRVNYGKSLLDKVVKYRAEHPKSSAAAIARRFNVSETSVWRWTRMADPDIEEPLGENVSEEARQALSEVTDTVATAVVREEKSRNELKETFFSFVKEDPTVGVEQLRELFDVPTPVLAGWMREAKRGAVKGISPKDKYTDEERKDLSTRFANRVVGGETYSQAAEKVGVSRSVLTRWCKNFRISLKRSGATKKKENTIGYLQFCLGKKPRDWTKLGEWLMANSTSKEKTVFAQQCAEMAEILQKGDVPPKPLFTACYRHWANAEMVAQGFKP